VVNQDLYRQTLEEMVDPRHPLVVLAGRIPWDELEARVEPLIIRNLRSARSVPQDDLFGSSLQVAGVRCGGRPRLPTRLMLSLLYLKCYRRVKIDWVNFPLAPTIGISNGR